MVSQRILRFAPLAFAVASLSWWAAIAATPVARSATGAPRLAAALFHGACGRLCHQRPERSFQTAGMPWPVCGRCAGLYGGAVLGAWAAWADLRRRKAARQRVSPPGTWRVPMVLAAAPTALAWGIEAAGLAPFSTVTRFVLAVPLGAAAAWAVSQALAHDEAGGLH